MGKRIDGGTASVELYIIGVLWRKWLDGFCELVVEF